VGVGVGGAQLTEHAGMPPTKGEKWVATKWIHERPYQNAPEPPTRGLSLLPPSLPPFNLPPPPLTQPRPSLDPPLTLACHP
jgi:hypothetical protein